MEVQNIQNALDVETVINHLILNSEIQFKSQQKNESDLSNEQKRNIALDLLNRSKPIFLNRFGKYLHKSHIEQFVSFVDSSEEGCELGLIIQNLLKYHSDENRRFNNKNRRYEALKMLIANESYFSESEMMKRNPLLYDQLVGQFLTEDERKERDNICEDSTLVKILMEGIERDDAKLLQNKQEEEEDNAMEEEDSSDDEMSAKIVHEPEPSTSHGNWGEFNEFNNDYTRKKDFFKKQKSTYITATERELLRDEFTTLMYRSFLDGKDDFDYTTVDDNEDYDNHDIVNNDAEEKYFDSEEPEIVEKNGLENEVESSEDELDIYMSALNQHPSVSKLSEDISRL